MTDNLLDEFLAENESFPGYTAEEADAIYQTLIAVGLKRVQTFTERFSAT